MGKGTPAPLIIQVLAELDKDVREEESSVSPNVCICGCECEFTSSWMKESVIY